MDIKSIEIQYYRSIGSKPVRINLEKKANILIGQNNAGKSNTIHALAVIDRWVRALRQNATPQPLNELEFHNRDRSNLPNIKVVLSRESRSKFNLEYGDIEYDITFSFNLDHNSFDVCDSTIFYLELAGINHFIKKYKNRQFQEKPNKNDWINIAREIINESSFLREVFKDFPRVYTIPGFRRVESDTIERLNRWKQPPISSPKDKKKFRRVQDFIRNILDLPELEIDIEEGKRINIDYRDLFLPLDYYGAGTQEVIIFSEQILNIENAIICIEEPEIHLHPSLQRKFLDTILNSTTNKYIIATHSNVFIQPRDEIQIIHLSQENGVTHSRHVENMQESKAIFNDLGYKASDLLQSNFIIWVEGPSDRIYLKRWLSLFNRELKEHVDYSIMYYGGILKYLALDLKNEGADEFIQLLRINPRAAIIIDKDEGAKGVNKDKEKRRIRKEAKEMDILCWVTKGLEIENYLPSHAISAFLSRICGDEREVILKEDETIDDAKARVWPDCEVKYSNHKPHFAAMIIDYLKKDDINGHLRKFLKNLCDRIKS